MLLTLQGTRHAANIPIGWFAMAIGIAALYALRFSVRSEAGPAVVGLLVIAIGVSQTRLMAVRGERLITPSPFGSPNSTRELAHAASNEWTIPAADARRCSCRRLT